MQDGEHDTEREFRIRFECESCGQEVPELFQDPGEDRELLSWCAGCVDARANDDGDQTDEERRADMLGPSVPSELYRRR